MARKIEDGAQEGEIVPVVDAVGELVRRDGDVVSRFLDREADSIEVDPEAAYAAIIDEIMTASSVTDVLNLPEPEKLEAFADRPIEIHGYKIQESDFEQGAPVYFTIGAVDLQTGKKVIINTGVQSVMAQLLRLKFLNAFPVRVIPKESPRANRFGRKPIRLTQLEG